MDSAGTAQLCCFERGFEVVGQPSLVFVRGFSFNKGTWLSVIKVRQQCFALLAGILVYLPIGLLHPFFDIVARSVAVGLL